MICLSLEATAGSGALKVSAGGQMTIPVSSDGESHWGEPWTQLDPNIPVLSYLYLAAWQTFTERLPSATAPAEVWDTPVGETKTLP